MQAEIKMTQREYVEKWAKLCLELANQLTKLGLASGMKDEELVLTISRIGALTAIVSDMSLGIVRVHLGSRDKATAEALSDKIASEISEFARAQLGVSTDVERVVYAVERSPKAEAEPEKKLPAKPDRKAN